MRLLSVRLRDYRLHRDLTVRFDPRLTVIEGPNESGKSTLAEALHRALFLSSRTGGAVLEGLRTLPSGGDPDVELRFEVNGEAWTLRKRFAGTRGSTALTDGGGRTLQGDPAEGRLAELIGTAAVERNTSAPRQLRERWGHLWVWQGTAGVNPLGLSAAGYDHDRLVERLQAGAELSVQSPLDLAVQADIQKRWESVFTTGGQAGRPRMGKAGSPLAAARAAALQAESDLGAIEAALREQEQARSLFEQADGALTRLCEQLPRLQRVRAELEGRLSRGRELSANAARIDAALTSLTAQLEPLGADQRQLLELTARLRQLDASLAPRLEQLEAERHRLPAAEQLRQREWEQLEQLRAVVSQLDRTAQTLDAQRSWTRRQQERQELERRLATAATLESRLTELEQELRRLPPVEAADVERLRELERERQNARVSLQSLAAGVEVLQAGQEVRIGDEPLAAGETRLLIEPAVLRIGGDVELRLSPGGATSVAEAREREIKAQSALTGELERLRVGGVEEGSRAERRRADLLGERQRLLEQRGVDDTAGLRRQAAALDAAIETERQALADAGAPVAAAGPEGLEERLIRLEAELLAQRRQREETVREGQAQRQRFEAAEAALRSLRQRLSEAERALGEERDLRLQAAARRDALIERHGSPDQLAAVIEGLHSEAQQRAAELAGLRDELEALQPEALSERAREIDAAITGLQAEQQQALLQRSRAEGQLQGDGRVDLQAELEQRQAALECRRAEVEGLEREARMLDLLRSLIEEEQNALASRYTAPLEARMEAYLGELFETTPQPGLRYDARQGFQDLRWQPGEGVAFGFEALSGGAREQLAAALRLSMAEVLAEAYDGCLPIVLDDAFVNADPDRQPGIARMLERAVRQGLQVILLTCDAERTGSLRQALRIRIGAADGIALAA
jgi:DNA repair exonuclease SbcCD ATPase subunit